MRLVLESYTQQVLRWPQNGRHVLAQFDDELVVVYQAYRPAIARFAVEHGHFGGEFSYARMSWIKPNFLWMMYRSGWGTKQDQEVVLAIWLRRSAFEQILREAVASSFDPQKYANQELWRADVAASQVRLQWDPDHDPSGAPVSRRAIQLGLRGDALSRYGHEWIVAIEDISDFVALQRERRDRHSRGLLELPRETVYPRPPGLP
jgi:hypothetical protein